MRPIAGAGCAAVSWQKEESIRAETAGGPVPGRQTAPRSEAWAAYNALCAAGQEPIASMQDAQYIVTAMQANVDRRKLLTANNKDTWEKLFSEYDKREATFILGRKKTSQAKQCHQRKDYHRARGRKHRGRRCCRCGSFTGMQREARLRVHCAMGSKRLRYSEKTGHHRSSTMEESTHDGTCHTGARGRAEVQDMSGRTRRDSAYKSRSGTSAVQAWHVHLLRKL